MSNKERAKRARHEYYQKLKEDSIKGVDEMNRETNKQIYERLASRLPPKELQKYPTPEQLQLRNDNTIEDSPIPEKS